MFKLKKHGKRKPKRSKRDKHASQSPSFRKILKNNCILNKKKHQSTKRPAKIIEHVTHPQIPDFRIEIEKRYSKSIVNKIYTFPKKEVEEGPGPRGEQKDDCNLDFLEKVTVYDLMAQNEERQKKKRRKQKNFTRKQRNSYRYNLSTSLNQTNTRDSNTRTHKKALYQKSLDMKDKALQRSLELKKKSSK